MALDLYKKEQIRSMFLAQGRYVTDAQIEEYYNKAQATQATQPEEPELWDPKEPTLASAYNDESTLEQALEATANLVWGGLDTALLGLPGLAWKGIDKESYEASMADLNDNALARVGGGIGGALGFLAPMGWSGRLLSYGARGLRGARQAKALKTGATTIDKIKAPTTEAIQTAAGSSLFKSAQKRASDLGTLTKDEAIEIAKRVSDDTIGFSLTGKKWWQKVFQGGPGYQMEHGLSSVNRFKELMKFQMSDRLAAELAESGVKLTNKQILKMSDDLVDMLGKKSFNTIDAMIQGSYMGRMHPALFNLLGGVVQEGIQFGLVGTAMDAVQYIKGDLDLNERSFADRVLHHVALGGVLGTVKFIPGGAKTPIWKNFVEASSFMTKKLNDKVGKMGLEELKAFGLVKMRNDRSSIFSITKNGKTINLTRKDLRPESTTIGNENIQSLRKTIQDHNTMLAKSLRGPYWTKFAANTRKDLVGSFVRMSVGAASMNYEAINAGAFEGLEDAEVAFHLALGAFMTKKHKPLFKDTAPRQGIHFGERDYHYFSDMTDVSNAIAKNSRYINNIGSLIKQFDGNTYTDWVNKYPIKDVERMIKVLKDNDIIYDSLDGEVTAKQITPVPHRELMDLLGPISAIMTSRGLRINPNATKEMQVKVLDIIKNMTSEELTSGDHIRKLDSRANVLQSVLAGSQRSIQKFQNDAYKLFDDMYKIITDGEYSITPEGEMFVFNLKHEHLDLNEQQSQTIAKFLELKENLRQENIIKLREIEHGKEAGLQHEVTMEMINKMEEFINRYERNLGAEILGEGWNAPADINDKMLWSLVNEVNHQRNVVNVFSIMNGEAITGVNEVDAKEIQSLIKQVLSHRDNFNNEIMVDNALKIDLIFDEGISITPQQQQALQSFIQDLWSINATVKAPTDIRRVEVPVSKVLALKEKLVNNGMPDHEIHMLDSRMANWVEKAVQHGIERATLGADMEPIIGVALKQLMKNGLIQTTTDSKNRGVRLVAPNKITVEQVERIIPNLTQKEKQAYVDAYTRVMDSIGKKLVARRDDFNITMLTAEQLSSITTADKMLDKNRYITDSEAKENIILEAIERTNVRRNVLQDQLKDPTIEDSAASQIRDLLNFETSKYQQLNEIHQAWRAAFAGGQEMTRAAAYLEFAGTTRNKDGKNIFDLIRDIEKSEDPFHKFTEDIKQLQNIIAEKVNERPSGKSWDERRNDFLIAEEQREIEGVLPDNRKHTNPDLFFEKYGIDKNDIFSVGEKYYRSTFETNAEALYELYNEVVVTQNQSREVFIDRVMELAGTNRAEASAELRNDVMVLSNLMDRRFKIKRLTVNQTSGTGVFENTEISKGFLTDIWTEIFSGINAPMLILDSGYTKNGKIQNIFTSPNGLNELTQILYGNEFFATLNQGENRYISSLKRGTAKPIEPGQEVWHTVDIAETYLKGAMYPVVVDENITVLIPEAHISHIKKPFMRWFEKIEKDPYTKKAIDKLPQAKELINELRNYYEIFKNGNGTPDSFVKDGQRWQESVHDAIFTIFNSMYGERIDGDWLQDAYTNGPGQRKHFKYKRLAQNQGYSRNSIARRETAKAIFGEGTGSSKYEKILIEKYADREINNIFVVNDGVNSEMGSAANQLITDNRSVAEHRLERMLERGDITKEDYKENLRLLENASSINAEAVNGMTPVRREYLDFLLLQNGDADLIGKSAGQKPVGLTSYTDSKGVVHVLYNKTHYFYDSRLDKFFELNPDIDMIAFTSGAKKAKIIDPNQSLENQLKPYEAIPVIGDLIKDKDGVERQVTIYDMLNSLNTNDSKRSIMPVRADQSLSGTVYGEHHNAKILKQFSNWTSPEVQRDLYRYARQDMIEQFSEVQMKFYNPENTALASAEAKSFLRTEGNKDGTIAVQTENASTEAIWIENSGIPFSISGNLYDAIIKKRYVDQAGIFDGFTDAGGSAILRGNMAMDLDIPVYKGNVQIKLGEANISEVYLDAKIHNISDYGPAQGKPRGREKRHYKSAAGITLVMEFRGDGTAPRDVLYDLKKGKISDPLNPKAKLEDYKALANAVDKILQEINMGDGRVSTYRDVYNILNGPGMGRPDGSRPVKLGIMGLPAPRTGPHDAVVMKVKGILDRKDGGIMEMNTYDLTMRAQRDFDTDKLYFYMDTPFSAMREAYKINGDVKEARTTEAFQGAGMPLNPYNRLSMENYTSNINEYRKKFGQVVKTQRKISFMKNLIDLMGTEPNTKNIPMDNKGDVRLVVEHNDSDFLQRLVSHTQGAVDIYGENGLPLYLANMKAWQREILFGSDKFKNPIFKLVDKNGNRLPMEEVHKLIIEKIMNDYGRLLSYEGNIWEAGESKRPRYKDMITGMELFNQEYSPDIINRNFYYYIEKKLSTEAANDFFGFAKTTEKGIDPFLQGISKAMRSHTDPFLRSMRAITSKDQFKVRETFSPDGEHFNATVQKLLGRHRAEMLETFRLEPQTGGERPLYLEGPKAETLIIDEMWRGFYKERNTEKALIQANAIEHQINSMERLVQKESKKPEEIRDDAFISMQEENIAIKRKALSVLLNKLTVEKDAGLPGQKMKYYKAKGKKGRNYIQVSGNNVMIKDAIKGTEKKVQLDKNGGYILQPNEVAVYNPVKLRAVREHDLIDGAAWANTVLGYWSRVTEADLPKFRKYVMETKNEIQKLISETMDNKNLKDWEAYEHRVFNAMERGLENILKMTMAEPGWSFKDAQGFPGYAKLPAGKESYLIDFLMAMLTPKGSGNPNEFYFSPKTGGFMPAVKAQSPVVVKAVMRMLDSYTVTPHKNELIAKMAQIHRGFYDAIVAGEGYHSAFDRIAEQSFEGALVNTIKNRVMHSPFMQHKDYKKLTEWLELGTGMEAKMAELMHQLLVDNAIIDPGTVMRLKEEIINKPGGEEAYKSLFTVSRGQLLFDGLNTKQFSTGKGEGQLVGELTMERPAIRSDRITGVGQRKRGTQISQWLQDQIGYENNVKCD